MRKSAITLTALGLVTVLAAAAPMQAQAHGWDRGGDRGGGWHRNNSGAAIGLGILGGVLAGAAIASQPHYYQPSYSYSPYGYGYGNGYTGYGYYR